MSNYILEHLKTLTFTFLSEEYPVEILPQKLMTLLTLICLLTSLEQFLPQVPL